MKHQSTQPADAQPQEKILVVGPSWVGDMVMASSLFQVLKQQYPQCHISVLAPQWCLALVSQMKEVDQALSLPFGHGVFALRKRWAFGVSLKTFGFTQAIVLPNSWKSAIIPFAANIPVRRGWRGEWRYGLLNDCRTLNKTALPSMISRFTALASATATQEPPPCPAPRLSTSSEEHSHTLEALRIDAHRYIALCPGAEFGMAKRWPPQHYAKLCELLIEKNWQPILLGSPKDAQTTAEICEKILPEKRKALIDLAGKTSLTQAINVLAGARAVVSNDSGLMHIAAAFNRPLIAIYGPTSSTFTPPSSPRARVLQLNLNCQPCHKRECPLPDGKDKHACMQDIAPERVFEALQSQMHSDNM